MKVATFMTPAATTKALTARPNDTIRRVADLMVTESNGNDNKTGAVVVVEKDKKHGTTRPLGIITKTDILLAYHHSSKTATNATTTVDMDHTACRDIMSTDITTVTPGMSYEEAGLVLHRRGHYYAIVIDDNHHNDFVGLVSCWDITVQYAKEHERQQHRVWPRKTKKKQQEQQPKQEQQQKQQQKQQQQQSVRKHSPKPYSHPSPTSSTDFVDPPLHKQDGRPGFNHSNVKESFITCMEEMSTAYSFR